jgi:hypothetical protein
MPSKDAITEFKLKYCPLPQEIEIYFVPNTIRGTPHNTNITKYSKREITAGLGIWFSGSILASMCKPPDLIPRMTTFHPKPKKDRLLQPEFNKASKIFHGRIRPVHLERRQWLLAGEVEQEKFWM